MILPQHVLDEYQKPDRFLGEDSDDYMKRLRKHYGDWRRKREAELNAFMRERNKNSTLKALIEDKANFVKLKNRQITVYLNIEALNQLAEMANYFNEMLYLGKKKLGRNSAAMLLVEHFRENPPPMDWLMSKRGKFLPAKGGRPKKECTLDLASVDDALLSSVDHGEATDEVPHPSEGPEDE